VQIVDDQDSRLLYLITKRLQIIGGNRLGVGSSKIDSGKVEHSSRRGGFRLGTVRTSQPSGEMHRQGRFSHTAWSNQQQRVAYVQGGVIGQCDKGGQAILLASDEVRQNPRSGGGLTTTHPPTGPLQGKGRDAT
jgi:hypothetical protein